MKKKKISLFSSFKTEFSKLNKNFLIGKCYVMALGKNDNRSHFSKESVEKAYPTLGFVPVIGHLMEDDNGNHYLGGHDVKLDLDTFQFKSQCVPFGVVMPSSSPAFEDIVNENNETVTYLVADVILWIGNYPELKEAAYSDEVYFNQSMEISFDNAKPLEEDNKYMDITDFTFDALCMLNKSDDPKFNVEPCFPNSSIVPNTFSLNDEFYTLFSKLKEELSNALKNEMKFLKEGGNMNLEKKLEIIKKFNKTIDELNFSIEDLIEEELLVKMEELYSNKSQDNSQSEATFSATYRQRLEILQAAFPDKYVRDDDGNLIEEVYFWISDFDEEYVYVNKSTWNKDESYKRQYFKYTYEINEDKTDVTLGEPTELFLSYLTQEELELINKEKADFEALKSEFDLYKENYSTSNEEVNILTEYKKTKETEEFVSQQTEVINEYKNLIGNTEEYARLAEEVANYSKEELIKECIYICGLYSQKKNFSKKVKEPIVIAVEKETEVKSSPYDGLFEQYLDKQL